MHPVVVVGSTQLVHCVPHTVPICRLTKVTQHLVWVWTVGKQRWRQDFPSIVYQVVSDTFDSIQSVRYSSTGPLLYIKNKDSIANYHITMKSSQMQPTQDNTLNALNPNVFWKRWCNMSKHRATCNLRLASEVLMEVTMKPTSSSSCIINKTKIKLPLCLIS
jgi:hypothetical protein